MSNLVSFRAASTNNLLTWMIIRNIGNLSKKWTQSAKYNNENICNANI